jgi:hypothetical protein
VLTISNKTHELYESYVAFCKRVDVTPLTEENWRWASDNKPFINMFSNWDERLRPPVFAATTSTERMRRLRQRRREARANQC